MSGKSLSGIIKDIKNFIALEKESGLDEVMLTSILKSKSETKGESGPILLDKKERLKALEEQALGCKECDLSESRRNVVFGQGNPHASLLFIGEAPGMEEDIQGKPFVGRAGTLLTKIIEAIGLKREDVYIANCLKCRPAQNRNPLPSEIIACRSFFMKQIEIIEPKVICCLGKFAAQTLLMTDESITRLRGKFYNFEDTKVMPTFHPAYLLRNPQDKRLVWEDMKKVRDHLKQSPA
ncbi:MAG: uracil-DNA glycosylase [Candidatus Omnitrophica bacterium]|nr:uracil-DNA glycosylase [Candidatus Omnitrophota bacterium]